MFQSVDVSPHSCSRRYSRRFEYIDGCIVVIDVHDLSVRLY